MKRLVSDWLLFNFDLIVELFGLLTSGILSFPDYNFNQLVLFDLRCQVSMYIPIWEIQGIDELFVDSRFGQFRS